MTPALSIKNLTKYYKKFKAVDDLSLEISEGEFFGFLGPNGAGKTTTISVVTGLANYQHGEVKVFGYDVVKDYRKARAQIGLVPQEFNFDPFLSAEQILNFEAGYFGVPSDEAKQRARHLLELFDLWEKRKEGYKRLSGGMKRRLLIARALMHNPKILILDEPTAGVDLELRHHLWDFLRDLNKKGTTILLTTHYIEEAEKLCNRIGVIHQGKIAALDETQDLIKNMSGNQVELSLKKSSRIEAFELSRFSASLEENGKRLRIDEKNGALSDVLKMLHDKNIEVESVNVRRPTLEDVFLKLVKRKEPLS